MQREDTGNRRGRVATLTSLIACLLLAAWPTFAHAELTVFVGAEYFDWKENTSPTVQETGPLLLGGVTLMQDKERGLLFGYLGEVYAGQVNYNGADLATGAPLTGKTDYFGVLNDGQMRYRFALKGNEHLDAVLALGADLWRRQLSSDQMEDWTVIYARFGAELAPQPHKPGLIASVGLKYPVYTNENAHLTDIGFDQNPTLTPGKDWSAYASIGYRIDGHWSVLGFYNSYRFQQSQSVQVTSGGTVYNVYQPKSSMDVLGLSLLYSF